jgi:transglutaminase-like putative cysteine protease
MLFLKLFETRTYRDGMVMITLSYFVIITNFFYTQNIPTAIYMLFVVAYITMALISLNVGTAAVSWREKLRFVVPLMVLALPLMVVFFLLFPRIPGTVWGLPEDATAGKTGLSDTMTPGPISQLALSEEVAFRVRFDGDIPSRASLYWRALVLWDYDGRTWRRGPQPDDQPPLSYERRGRPISYTVTLEAHRQPWLFALDLAAWDRSGEPPNGYRVTQEPDAELRTSSPVVNLTQYQVTSWLDHRLGSETLPRSERARALRLPADTNPRAVALAQRWRTEGGGARRMVDRALQRFNREFTYTLRPPVLGEDPVDQFLFESRRGFCEHFAGAFVVLMRAAGVPARVVTGYQGGEINPMGDYMLVRQSDAHAWAEVWMEDDGWVRVDPTQAVSPARIERGLDQAMPAGENPRYRISRDSEWVKDLGLLWDSLNNRWNQWVLGYGPDMQRGFLSYLGFEDGSTYDLVLLLAAAVASTLALIALISLRRYQQHRHDPVQRIWLRFCRKLARAGFVRRPEEGPRAYLERIRRRAPELADRIEPVVQHYIALRYRPGGDGDHDERLKRFRQAGKAVRVARLGAGRQDTARA